MSESAVVAPPADLMARVPRAKYLPLVRRFQSLKALAFVAAVAMGVLGRATRLDLALMATMSLLTMLGITAGYHRLLTHRSYEAHPALRRVLVVLGTMAGQGSPLIWPAIHRRHHQAADGQDDPHSPHGDENWPSWRRLWQAQVGWILSYYPEGLNRYVPDLMADPWLMRMHANAFRWVLVGIAVPTVIGAGMTGTWQGAVSAMIFGGWARLYLVEAATGTINSFGHLWGRRPFVTPDRSTNLGIWSLLALGEGWHNNHHAFPSSARHGLGTWELDPTWIFIRCAERVGLASRVLVPDAEQIAARRAQIAEDAA